MDTLNKNVTFLSALLASCFLLWIQQGAPYLFHTVLYCMTVAVNKMHKISGSHSCAVEVYLDVTMYHLASGSHHFEGLQCLHLLGQTSTILGMLAPEDEGTVILPNTENYSPNMTQHDTCCMQC